MLFIVRCLFLLQVDDDYFPIVESAMDDSREALQRFCSQDVSADARHPPMNLNDSVSLNRRCTVGLTGSLKSQEEVKVPTLCDPAV